MAEVDNLLLSLIEKEIPEGRQALRDGHENLAKVAAYCEQKYVETNNRYKSGPDRGKALEETRAVLEETKQFATQSLASVAYQINTLALNMLGLLDQQVLKLQDMESKINHISEVGLSTYFFQSRLYQTFYFRLRLKNYTNIGIPERQIFNTKGTFSGHDYKKNF